MNQFIQRVANYIANVSHSLHMSISLLWKGYSWEKIRFYFFIETRCSLHIQRKDRLTHFLTSLHSQELLIKGLAESRAFQRFALRTHNTIEDIKGKGAQSLNSAFDEAQKAATDTAFKSTSRSSSSAAGTGGRPQPPLRGFAGFMSAFAKEVKKDLGLGK